MPRFVPAPHVLFPALAIALSTGAAAAQSFDEDSRMTELSEMQSDNPLTFGLANTTVEIYGYFKVDFIKDFGAELGNTTFGLAGVIDDDQGSFYNQTAKQTRFGFNSYTPFSFGEFQTQLELDLYGENDYEPRVRIANASLLGVQVGKDWSVFVPLASYPGTLDFQGFAGIPFARQEQIRYTTNFSDYKLELSVEESNNAGYDNYVGVAALSYDTDPLLLRGAILGGKTENDAGDEGDAFGVNLSTTAQLREGLSLNAAVTYGEGISTYMVFFGSDFDASGDLVENFGAYAGLTQIIAEDIELQAIYGYREDDTSNPISDTAFERLQTLHLTAQYSITDNATIGAEYFVGKKKAYSGEDFTVDRVQLSAQYNF